MSAVAESELAYPVEVSVERAFAKEPASCPVDGCDRLLSKNRAMCRDCWSKVPREVKSLIRHQAGPKGSYDEWVAAMCAGVHWAEIA